MKTLPHSFFDRSAVRVARELIGKTLVRKVRGKEYRYTITETEAYDGSHDLASHASKGRTARTEIMFQKAGTLYVYLVYGMYWMINVVTGPHDYPAAVLIRGVEKVSGPGRVSTKLKVTGAFNGKMASKETGLWFEDGPKIPRKNILVTPRIGVNYAGPVWSAKPYRFVLKSFERV